MPHCAGVFPGRRRRRGVFPGAPDHLPIPWGRPSNHPPLSLRALDHQSSRLYVSLCMLRAACATCSFPRPHTATRSPTIRRILHTLLHSPLQESDAAVRRTGGDLPIPPRTAHYCHAIHPCRWGRRLRAETTATRARSTAATKAGMVKAATRRTLATEPRAQNPMRSEALRGTPVLRVPAIPDE